MHDHQPATSQIHDTHALLAHTGDLWFLIQDALLHAIGITLFVFLMMIIIDYFNVWTEGRLSGFMRGGKLRQYLSCAGLGVAPGCLGSFLVVTMYIRGMLGFGAVCACMFASSGDAAFVMLAEIPNVAFPLFGLLFVLAIVAGWGADLLAKKFDLPQCVVCQGEEHHDLEHHCRTWPLRGVWQLWATPHPARLAYFTLVFVAAVAFFGGYLGPSKINWVWISVVVLLGIGLFVVITTPDEYILDHLWHHVTKKHIPKVLLWTSATLVLLALAHHFLDLEPLVSKYMVLMILAAGLIGILPDSGPHLLFVFLYANGTIPFSVLLTSSIVQDGHGQLPLLSASVPDAVRVKLYNLALGLAIGFVVYGLGY